MRGSSELSRYSRAGTACCTELLEPSLVVGQPVASVACNDGYDVQGVCAAAGSRPRDIRMPTTTDSAVFFTHMGNVLGVGCT